MTDHSNPRRVTLATTTIATTTLPTITMAQAIERYFNVALYLLVLTGFGALASTGGLDLPAVVLVGLALALRGYQLLTRREFAIPERWTNILTLIYVFIYLADYFFLSRSFLASQRSPCALLHGRPTVLVAADARPLHARGAFVSDGAGRRRAYCRQCLSAFFRGLPAGCGRHFCVDGNAALGRQPNATHAQDPRVASPARPMAYGLLAIAPALMLMILAGSFLIFFLASPRFFTLSERLHSHQRCLHRLHRSRATGPHRPDSAVQCSRHAHRDPERSAGRLRLEVAWGCAQRF